MVFLLLHGVLRWCPRFLSLCFLCCICCQKSITVNGVEDTDMERVATGRLALWELNSFTNFNLFNLHNKSVRQSYSHFKAKRCDLPEAVFTSQPARLTPEPKPCSSCVPVQSFSRVPLFLTLWTVAHQTPLSMEFPRQEYWSELPVPPPGSFLALWFTFPLLKLCYF